MRKIHQKKNWQTLIQKNSLMTILKMNRNLSVSYTHLDVYKRQNPVSNGTRGAMKRNCEIDGYQLNADGIWVVNGVVQTK